MDGDEMEKFVKMGDRTFKVRGQVGTQNAPTVYHFLVAMARVGGQLVETDEVVPVNREGVLEFGSHETNEFSE